MPSSARRSSRSSTRCWPCPRAPGSSSSAPLIKDRKTEGDRIIEAARRQGYVRVRVDGEMLDIGDVAQARQVQAPFHRGRGRPLRGPPCRGARGRGPRRGRPADRPGDGPRDPGPGRRPPRRLDRDRPAPRRGRRPDRAVAARRRGPRLRGAALQREVQLPVRRLHRRGARAADVLLQLPARRVPGLHRPGDPSRDRPGPRHPGPFEEPRHRGAGAVGADADRRVVAAQDPRGHLRVARLGLHRADRRPAGRGGRVRAACRQEREGRRPLPPRARREHLQRDLRGRRSPTSSGATARPTRTT